MATVIYLSFAYAGLGQPPTAGNRPLIPLRPASVAKAQGVRSLTPDDLSRSIPVALTGVVTHVNHAVPDLFVQDETAGIYVIPRSLDWPVKVGDRVEVRGTANAGAFAPCVADATVVRAGGVAPLPDPLPYDLNRNDSRWLDGQWVQVWGTGVSVGVEGPRSVLRVRTAQGLGRVLLHGTDRTGELARFVGRTIRVRAVCVPVFDEVRHVVNGPPRLFVTSADQIFDAAAVPNPRAEPVLLIDHLMRFLPSPYSGARAVSVEGVVIGRAEGVLFVQDGRSGVSVNAAGPADVRAGDRVRVVGELTILGAVCHLSGATVTPLGSGELPPPAPASLADLAHGTAHGTRCRVEGRVVEITGATTQCPSAIVECGPLRGILRVVSDPAAVTRLPVGGTVAVTGVVVCDAVTETHATIGLLAADEADLEVLSRPERPSWWRGPAGDTFAAALVVFIPLSTVWVYVLCRTVRRQKADIHVKATRERDLAEKLRQSAKMEAIGRLAGGIAHDFNNLLTVINGSAELLPDFIPAGGAASDLAADIHSAGRKAAGLVAQLLTFSRQRPAQLAPLDLDDVVRDAEKLLGRLLGEDLTLDVENGPGVPRVLGEPVLLHQVIVNLAVNARDAMPEGGLLRIATTATATGARLTVTDTGCGMTDAVKAKLFEPFFTTKDVGKGTGLGLATVYGIVQTLGGEIRVRSAVGRGTTFEIDLPAAPADAGVTPSNGTITPRGMRAVAAKTTVLLVEDDDAVRALVARVLEADGYRVLAAETPHAALGALDAAPADVLITDVVMPGMGGRDMAEAVRVRLPDVKILFMSGYTAYEILRRGVQEDDVDFLHKPFSNAALSAKVAELARRTGAKSSRQKVPAPANVL